MTSRLPQSGFSTSPVKPRFPCWAPVVSTLIQTGSEPANRERALLKSVPLLPLLFLSEWVVKVVSRERFLALIEILPNIEDVSDSFGVCSCWGICNFVGGFILLVGGAKASHVELRFFIRGNSGLVL